MPETVNAPVDTSFSRRRFLIQTAMSGAALLAACNLPPGTDALPRRLTAKVAHRFIGDPGA